MCIFLDRVEACMCMWRRRVAAGGERCWKIGEELAQHVVGSSVVGSDEA